MQKKNKFFGLVKIDICNLDYDVITIYVRDYVMGVSKIYGTFIVLFGIHDSSGSLISADEILYTKHLIVNIHLDK